MVIDSTPTNSIHVSTVAGRNFDVASEPFAGAVCAELERSHNYRKGVKLMQNNRVLKPEEAIDNAFPVLVIGVQAHGGHSQPGATREPSISPSRRPHHPSTTMLEIHLLVTAHNVTHTVHVPPDASVGDLITALLAKEPSQHGCRLIFCGHELSDTTRELRQYGVRGDATVHVVSRLIDNNTLKLNEVMRKLEAFEEETKQPVTVARKKLIYEDTMRLLFSLDSLDELSDEARALRKQLVKKLQAFQDSIMGTHSVD